VQKALAVQFDYPYIHPGESAVSEEVTAAYRPFSHQVEALRALRSQILVRAPADQDGARVIAIVSPDRGEGRSYLAANLAVVFSQLGENTLLIDADLRNPRQHALFGVASTLGLSTLLAGRAGVEAISRVPKLHGLSLLPAGPRPPNPAELVTRVPFLQQIRAGGPQYDVIVIDTPASKLGPDAETVAGRAGGAVFVARAHASRRDDVFTLRDRVLAANAAVIGVVLNDF
jgi:chain length determinant protein tyrosine kinase EpsG